MDADVIVVGAGPTGLMLAGELRLGGVRPLVLEPRVRDVAKANGLGGQILRLLHYRGVLGDIEAASTDAHPAPRFPFGGVHVDFTHLADSPMQAIQIPQTRLEGLLQERASALGAEVRRNHEVVGVTQDASMVVADVNGPDGPYRVTAPYLVGCDGARSRVRGLAGIAFPGTTYPEINRIAEVTVPDGMALLDNGDLQVAGHGTIRAGFTRTDAGVFAFGALTPELLMVFTAEDEAAEYDDNVPMTVDEFEASIQRVLGAEFSLGRPSRLSRYTFHARLADRYREGRILLAGDAAHLFPATGVALNAGLLDTVNVAWKLAAGIRGWGPAGLLDTYHEERHLAGERTMLHTQAQVALRRGHDPAADALRELFQELLADEQPSRRMAALIAGTDIRYPVHGTGHHALTGTFAPDLVLRTEVGMSSVAELMRTARPVLLDLTDRRSLRDVASAWAGRVDVHTAATDARPADAVLIRPDAYIAWAAAVGEPDESATLSLRSALGRWFGEP